MPAALARTAKSKKAMGFLRPHRVGMPKPDQQQTGRIGCSPCAQPDPALQCSCFQIGTVSFNVSMQYRAASNAASRCGDDDRDRDRRLRQRELADAVMQRDPFEIGPPAARFGGDLAHHADAQAPRTPRRSSREHPRALLRDRARFRGRHTTAPERGVDAQACSASTGRAASVSTTQSSASVGGVSTANSLRKELPGLPGSRNYNGCGITWRQARSRNGNPSLHSIAMGFGGATGYGDGEPDDDRPTTVTTTSLAIALTALSPTRSIGSGCIPASCRRSRRPRSHAPARCGPPHFSQAPQAQS